MKTILIIPDGAADRPQRQFSGQTPLQAAALPQMDLVATAGITGLAETVPLSLPAGSDVGTMSLFGYDPLIYHTGRAPIEAAAQRISLGPNDWAIRCNLVTVQNGVMESFTAGQIDNDSAAELLTLLQNDFDGTQHQSHNWRFYPGVSYRNLLVCRSENRSPFSAKTTSAKETAGTVTIPPHDLIDQPIAQFLPQGSGSDLLRQLMHRSSELFADCPTNRRLLAAGQLPATQIWLWGEGSAPQMPLFFDRFHKKGAVITAVDLLRGLGRLIGWDIIDVPEATGYLDTNYAAKGRHAIAAIQNDLDFVVVHIEAPDEASHEGNAAAKVDALEQIDRHIVGPVHQFLKQCGDDYRLLISPDHPTLLQTKTHSHGAVPFAMCGSGISPDAGNRYDETAALQPRKTIAGHELLPRLFS